MKINFKKLRKYSWHCTKTFFWLLMMISWIFTVIAMIDGDQSSSDKWFDVGLIFFMCIISFEVNRLKEYVEGVYRYLGEVADAITEFEEKTGKKVTFGNKEDAGG